MKQFMTFFVLVAVVAQGQNPLDRVTSRRPAQPAAKSQQAPAPAAEQVGYLEKIDPKTGKLTIYRLKGINNQIVSGDIEKALKGLTEGQKHTALGKLVREAEMDDKTPTITATEIKRVKKDAIEQSGQGACFFFGYRRSFYAYRYGWGAFGGGCGPVCNPCRPICPPPVIVRPVPVPVPVPVATPVPVPVPTPVPVPVCPQVVYFAFPYNGCDYRFIYQTPYGGCGPGVGVGGGVAGGGVVAGGGIAVGPRGGVIAGGGIAAGGGVIGNGYGGGYGGGFGGGAGFGGYIPPYNGLVPPAAGTIPPGAPGVGVPGNGAPAVPYDIQENPLDNKINLRRVKR